MFGFCISRLQLLVPSICHDSSVTHIQKALSFSTSHSSLLGSDGKQQSFTVSYLINSIGFSPERALSLSKKLRVQFESPEQPDSVIKVLKNYGFSDTHISKILNKHPSLLSCNAQKTLVPKLEYFFSIGIKGTALAKTLCGNPSLLSYSIEEYLMPCLDIIETLPISNEKVAVFLGNSYQALGVRALSNIAPNVSFLREVSMPEDLISLFLVAEPYVMSLDNAKFKENVNKVTSIGFCPSRDTFLRALHVISEMLPSRWEKKMEFYQKCGWTEDHFLFAFRSNPLFLNLSEKNISSKLDFLVNRFGWQAEYVAKNPSVLTHSLENCIIPRCSVIRVLLLKGLIRKGEFSLAATLTRSKINFLDRFVKRYQEQVPELFDIFQGKISLVDVGLGFLERGGAK